MRCVVIAGSPHPYKRASNSNQFINAALTRSVEEFFRFGERHRWSTRTRAIVHGLIVAIVLFAGAAVFMRLWATLASFIP